MPPFRPRSPRRHRGDTIFIEAGYASEAVGVTVENLIFDSASATSTGIVLNLGAGIAQVTLQGEAPIFVTGNGDANTIVGNSGNNTFNGGGGSDILNGGAGRGYVQPHPGRGRRCHQQRYRQRRRRGSPQSLGHRRRRHRSGVLRERQN